MNERDHLKAELEPENDEDTSDNKFQCSSVYSEEETFTVLYSQ